MNTSSSLRKFTNLLLVTILSINLFPADARNNATLLEFVSGTQQNMDVFILNRDLELDLAREVARVRLFADVEPLMVQASYPQNYKVKAYTLGTGGQGEVLHSYSTHSIKRRNRTRSRFVVELGYVEGDQEVYFDFYDSADRYVSTYKQTIDFSNLQEQVAVTTPISAANCDNSTFNSCHLDYIMEQINFVLQPKNNNTANAIKNADGSYNVLLSIPRTVREQILKGNFDVQAALANLGGNGGVLNGDDLGNHMATQDLDMKGFNIVNVGKITATDLMVSNSTMLEDLIVNGDFFLPKGAVNGYVLSVDANGKTSWVSLASLSVNGDNLGNHIATQNLDMMNFDINNIDTTYTEKIVVNGSFIYKPNANFGYILTSDANGLGQWLPASFSANGDNLGNHVADTNLNMNGFSLNNANQVNASAGIFANGSVSNLVAVNSIQYMNGASAGFVLTSDAAGNATWQAASGGGNGDNLGNHIATMALDLNGNNINTVNQINASVGTFGNGNLSNLVIVNSLQYMNGAAAGFVLTSDANGNASWQAGSGNGDNLGNHMATQSLSMQNFDILGVGAVNALNLNASNGASLADTVVNGNLTVFSNFIYPTGAATGFVLTSDANGNASWQAASGGNGDNLGNHTATQNLNMSNLNILSAGSVFSQVLDTQDLIVRNGAFANFVLTSDSNGVASWAPVPGDNLGNHIATTELFMNGQTLRMVGGVDHVLQSDNGTTAVAVNWATSTVAEVILFGNATLTFTNNPQGTSKLVLVVKQDATGNRTLTYPGTVRWSNGSIPTLSNGANAVDMIDCLYHGTDLLYYCDMRGSNYQ